jgi:hypothetical protein
LLEELTMAESTAPTSPTATALTATAGVGRPLWYQESNRDCVEIMLGLIERPMYIYIGLRRSRGL